MTNKWIKEPTVLFSPIFFNMGKAVYHCVSRNGPIQALICICLCSISKMMSIHGCIWANNKLTICIWVDSLLVCHYSGRCIIDLQQIETSVSHDIFLLRGTLKRRAACIVSYLINKESCRLYHGKHPCHLCVFKTAFRNTLKHTQTNQSSFSFPSVLSDDIF